MLSRVKRLLTVAVCYGLYYSGLLGLWQRVVLRRRAVVLMYHRVLTPDERRATGSHPGIVVERSTFAEQMAILKRHFVVLSLEEFAGRLRQQEPFPDSSCLITFDDGWHDNFTNGLPVLQEHGLPAIVFLPMNYIGTRRLFWREALVHLLVHAVSEMRRTPSRRPRLQELLQPAGLDGVLDIREDDHDLIPVIAETIDARMRLSQEATRDLLTVLADELRVRPEDLRTPDVFMTWEQTATMSRQNVVFGGHGSEHRPLTMVSGDEAEEDIRESKRVLDRTFSPSIPTFSYPNGYWNADVAGKVKDAGYQLAFTTQPGFVSCGDDPLALRRLNIHEDMTDRPPLFMARLVGLL